MTVTDLPVPSEISDDEIRQWAHATGRTVGQKGRISRELRTEYERMAGGSEDVLPEGAVPRDISPAAPQDPQDAPERPARAETRPRQVKTQGGWRGRVWGQAKPAAKGGKAKPRHPRISVAKLCERGWSTLARMTQPVNLPVARVLEFQAPAAGEMLEDVVRGTVADLFLQPLARAEAKLEVLGGLAGPPVLVLAAQMPACQPVHEDGTPYPAGAVRQAIVMSALEEALMMWDDATRSRMAEVRERIQASEARRKEVQALIAMFFAPPDDVAQAQAAEEAAMATAREHMRGTN
jgi:hypothetical protein